MFPQEGTPSLLCGGVTGGAFELRYGDIVYIQSLPVSSLSKPALYPVLPGGGLSWSVYYNSTYSGLDSQEGIPSLQRFVVLGSLPQWCWTDGLFDFHVLYIVVSCCITSDCVTVWHYHIITRYIMRIISRPLCTLTYSVPQPRGQTAEWRNIRAVLSQQVY